MIDRSLTARALRAPAAVAAAVAAVLLFGVYGLTRLPVQLFPDIERPQLNIKVYWRAAAPSEVESEIVVPVERALHGLPGLQGITAWANQGLAWINLEFSLGADMGRALTEVNSRLSGMEPLPRDAGEPRVEQGAGYGARPVLLYLYLQALPGNPRPVADYARLVEDEIRPALEAVPGVARVRIAMGGGGDEELQILFDPYRAAQFGIPIPRLAELAGRARDVSGGYVEVGRREYALRFAGRYSAETLGELVLDWRDGSPLRLRDVAQVRRARDAGRIAGGVTVIQNGNPAILLSVERGFRANALDAITRIEEVVAELNSRRLAPLALTLAPSHDAATYIRRAIGLVSGNLTLGVLLTLATLWWFLRRLRPTLIVALAIPISLMATLGALHVAGRNLNVIALAGLALAVGMVVDAAIVVTENIVRLRERGLPPVDAAIQGAGGVRGALVAATATTVAVFVPVLFLEDVAGQVFGELAITTAVAVSVSLLVALTVVPLACARYLREVKSADSHTALWDRITNAVLRATATPPRRWSLVLTLTIVPTAGAWLLLPPFDYLPSVKRDELAGYFSFPPAISGASIRQDYVDVIRRRLAPYLSGDKQPALRNYQIEARPDHGVVIVRTRDRARIDEMHGVLRDEILAGLPDLRPGTARGNLFSGIGGDRNLRILLQSGDRQALGAAAIALRDRLAQRPPGLNPYVNPQTEQADPELRLHPVDRAIQESGWDRGTLGEIVRALGEGLYIGEHFDGERRLDLILRAQDWTHPEALAALPLATPAGTVRAVGELVRIEQTTGPNELIRVDGRPTATLDILTPEDLTVETLMEAVQSEAEPVVHEYLAQDGAVRFSGSASGLDRALASLGGCLGLALVLLFLLMAALFRSPGDAALVMLALPLSLAGGVLALRLLNLVTFQSLDLLTMMGFVILLGVVVNNAILLVERTRGAQREGLDRDAAVARALRERLRPIFMSTLTTLLGMLPLLLFPGPGSVIYRGLAAVIVGGLALGTVLSLVLLPGLLRLGGRHVAVPARAPLEIAA